MTAETSSRRHQCPELPPQERVAGSQVMWGQCQGFKSKAFLLVVCREQCYHSTLAEPACGLSLPAVWAMLPSAADEGDCTGAALS